jgi:tyrosyl-tRNA synthetase
MGKTEGNMISFMDKPHDMFGKVMSWSDGMIINGFEICTTVPLEEIETFKKDMASGKNPMEFKKLLAYEIVKTFYGEKKAITAREEFSSTFQKGEIPEDMTKVKAGDGKKSLMDLLVEAKILSSKGEFRRLVVEGAVTNLDTDKKVKDVNIVPTKGGRFKIGKKRFIKII